MEVGIGSGFGVAAREFVVDFKIGLIIGFSGRGLCTKPAAMWGGVLVACFGLAPVDDGGGGGVDIGRNRLFRGVGVTE